MPAADNRVFAPSCERNRDPIFAVLHELLPPTAQVLEVAAGTGEHAYYFTEKSPQWQWQTTDLDVNALESQKAWRDFAEKERGENPRMAPPLKLNVLHEPWFKEEARFDALYCCNMIHISPWACTAALFAGAAKYVKPEGHVVTYGPYKKNGEHISESNVRFEQWLKDKDPQFGVRDRAEVKAAALEHGWICIAEKDLPANNNMLIFKRK